MNKVKEAFELFASWTRIRAARLSNRRVALRCDAVLAFPSS